MLISSLLATRVELEVFVGEKLGGLLGKETRPLAEILMFVVDGYRRNTGDFEELLIREKKQKVEL